MVENVENVTNQGGVAGILGDVRIEDAQRYIEQGREALDQAVDTAESFIRERPLVCLAGALAIGYVIGKIVSR
jgi:ElaB/YqjD/DUF883 family membrane-anchored ribosome-binding protein